jgi:hypothetical protein
MKIKFLSIFLVIAGIIMISGCAGMEKQPLTSKAPYGLYRSIFFPHTEILDYKSSHMPGESSTDLFPPHPGPEPTHNLSDAISLLDRNIQKADITSMRLEAGIQRQEAEGKNVSRVEALLEKYKLLVEEAKKYRALADETVAEEKNSSIADTNLEDSSSENMEREYLIESQNSMIQANEVLREIFKELQHLMAGSEELNSTSRLSAAGEGMVNLMGNFTLKLHVEEGEMAIPDLSQDSDIYIKGDYTLEERTERTEMQNEMRLYHIHSADVKISGSRKAVMLKGKNITLTTDGEGYAAFLGNGTYSIEDTSAIKKERNWARPFFREGTSPGEQGHRGSSEYRPDGPSEYEPNGPGEYE